MDIYRKISKAFDAAVAESAERALKVTRDGGPGSFGGACRLQYDARFLNGRGTGGYFALRRIGANEREIDYILAFEVQTQAVS